MAEARVARLTRFASRINRTLPAALAPARVWSTSNVLDAWTPLGPGNIGGGASWTAIDGDGDGALPDIPVHSIVVDRTTRRGCISVPTWA